MPDYEKAARKAAAKYGIDPAIFIAQLKQESGLRPGLTSGAGAQGIAQFMPATAKAYGVNLHDGKVTDDLDGAARYMRDNLDRTGDDYAAALSIYNSGRPDAYKNPQFAGGQTYDYVKGILAAAKSTPKVKAPKKTSTQVPQATATTTTAPGVNNAPLRQQLVSQFLQQGGVTNPNAVLGLASQYGQAQDVPGTTTTTYGQQRPQARPQGKGGVRISPRAKAGDPVVSSKQSVGGEHETAGLAGYPAKDYFAPAGTHAVAPVSGTVIRLSGHDPKGGPTNGPHGPLGWSVYIKGVDGKTYFLTHMGQRSVKAGQKVKQGQVIGTVADYDQYGTPSHIHQGVSG